MPWQDFCMGLVILSLIVLINFIRHTALLFTKWAVINAFLVGFLFVQTAFSATDNFTSSSKDPAFLQVKSGWADSVFKSLTPDERIAQLFMVAAYSSKDETHYAEIAKLVKDYKIGGLIFFKGSPVKQAHLTNYYQQQAKTPLFIAIDGEWGLSMRLDSTIVYPRQMMLGAIQNDALIYEMGKQIAQQCQALGIHINFAPVIDVNNNADNPVINNRSFGELKEHVAKLGIAYMKGMQDQHVMACGKHFPGHGDTDMDSHLSLPTIAHDYTRLDSLELYPFKALINEGLASMMVAHLYIPSLDNTPNQASTLSPNIVNGLLKDSLGFKGLIFTDALNMQGVANYYEPGEVDVKALLAGNDILLFAQDVPLAIAKIKQAIAEGKITQEEIDARCLKILKAKEWAGLNKYQPIDTKNLHETLNPYKAEVLNRMLAKESVTLIHNQQNELPLGRTDTLKIAYLNIGGVNNNQFYETMLRYTTIDQIQIPRALSSTEEDELIEQCKTYDKIIVGFHRTSNDPKKNFGVTIQSIQIFQEISKSSAVTGVLFGNAYALDKFGALENTKAFIVAYQDNDYTNEYAAQVLFGGVLPKGKLPVSGNSFFPAGTGMTYENTTRLAFVLPEEIGINSTDLKKIDSLALAGIKMGAYPGCQIVAIKNGNVFYQKSFGYHTYEKKRAVKNTDLYDLASITKIAATTISVIQLQQEGLIDIDKPLTKYIPDLVDSTPYQNMVIRRMLAHEAGLVNWIPFYTQTLLNGKPNPIYYSSKKDSIYSVRVTQNLYITPKIDTLIFQKIITTPLGKKTYKYSDLGYYFLREIIKRITGKGVDEYAFEHFYKPMNLYSMGYNPLDRFTTDEITPTENDTVFRQQLIHGTVHDQGAAMLGGVGGHAGLFSNATDLATLMYMLTCGGNYAGTSFLNKDTLADFTRQQYSDNRRGAGFDKPVRSLDGGPTCNKVSLESYGHSGFTGTITWADPANKIVYVFLSNRCYPIAENPLLLKEGIRVSIQDAIYIACKQAK
ncbi:MAG: serine hydrolase [Crocinitomicaceae bacterium]|nr:serine hydrolase [Crocinitomicaceae bacterium]